MGYCYIEWVFEESKKEEHLGGNKQELEQPTSSSHFLGFVGEPSPSEYSNTTLTSLLWFGFLWDYPWVGRTQTLTSYEPPLIMYILLELRLKGGPWLGSLEH